MEYYKKVDKSFLDGAMTIPNKYLEIFLQDESIPLGKSREVFLKFKNKQFRADLRHVGRTAKKSYYSLLWNNNHELINEVRKEFIQSYFAIYSEKFNSRNKNKHYITSLPGGNLEVIVFENIDVCNFKLETFIKITTPYDNMFKKLLEENVFGWLSDINKDYLYTKTTKWFNRSELKNHEDKTYVVYYLLDEEKKQLYIGSAKNIGKRFVNERKEIPGWNKFRYDIIQPQYHHLLRRIEHHTITAFASIMINNCKINRLNISDYTLINKVVSKGAEKR